ncbi:MAG TPA: exodeoxyribonuclease VII large subunit, partial [Candidatus Thermoplasmatota archaeon]|nr:exodeoxyribonuclease VII large subunit [Candidatus Thermoplasmatota archaeon]
MRRVRVDRGQSSLDVGGPAPVPVTPRTEEPRIHSITALTTHLANLLEGDPLARNVWVRGEISNFKAHGSGHFYFSLKDEGSAIPCAMFRGDNLRLTFEPQDGMAVFARGSVSIYKPRGYYQLVVKEMRPDGAGAKAVALQALAKKLQAEGLFDPERKRDLPALPRRIGIVTSLSGAAVRDIITVARRRFPPAELVIRPVRVQGDTAAAEIVAAIELFNRLDAADVLIVGRGGGSIEDLWAFNEEPVVRAIAASRIPVVSAVGHETDVTLADLAADLRAATPSAAAEAVTPDAEGLYAALAESEQALRRALTAQVALARARLEALERSPLLREPERALQAAHQRVDEAAERLAASARLALERKAHALGQAAALLDSFSPLKVLGRGYAVAHTGDGRLVTDATALSPGTEVRVRVN